MSWGALRGGETDNNAEYGEDPSKGGVADKGGRRIKLSGTMEPALY
jgi:hypothetical protein